MTASVTLHSDGALQPHGVPLLCYVECFYLFQRLVLSWWPGAGVFVFSFHLIFFYPSTDQALVWRRMETDEGEEDGWNFGEPRSVRIVGYFMCFLWRSSWGRVFSYAIASELHASVI